MHRQTGVPVGAPAAARLAATLLPSPTLVICRPSSPPKASRNVKISVRAWQGCLESVSAFMTGIDAADARSSTSACAKVLITTASTYRERTLAVSWMVSETVSYTHLRAHETKANLVCRL